MSQRGAEQPETYTKDASKDCLQGCSTTKLEPQHLERDWTRSTQPEYHHHPDHRPTPTRKQRLGPGLVPTGLRLQG